MAKIDFLPDNKIYESEPGETILQTASRNGIPHVAACGGEGKCTTCRLLILDGIDNCSPETDTEVSLKERHTQLKNLDWLVRQPLMVILSSADWS